MAQLECMNKISIMCTQFVLIGASCNLATYKQYGNESALAVVLAYQDCSCSLEYKTSIVPAPTPKSYIDIVSKP